MGLHIAQSDSKCASYQTLDSVPSAPGHPKHKNTIQIEASQSNKSNHHCDTELCKVDKSLSFVKLVIKIVASGQQFQLSPKLEMEMNNKQLHLRF